MTCTSTPATYTLPDSEHTLYKILSVTCLILALFNGTLYLLLTHFRYQPSFRFTPQRSGRRTWLLLVLSLCFIGQACNDVYHAHLSPCFASISLWPEYMSARLVFQAPLGGIAALVQLERASSICLKDYKMRQRLWVAGLVLNLIITPMNVVFTAVDAEQHKHTQGYWPQYQGADWLYLVNFVFPIVGVAATVWTTRVAFSAARVKSLKVASGSSSGNVNRANSGSTSLASVSVSAAKLGGVGMASTEATNGPQQLASTGKCLSFRLLAQRAGQPSSPTTPIPSAAAASPIQSSIQLTFKFLSVMSMFSWVIGSAMVLGASQMSPAPRFCVAAMSGFPGLTVEILFKRLVRLRHSRRGQGKGVRQPGGKRLLSGRNLAPAVDGKSHPLESLAAGGGIDAVEGFELRSGVDDGGEQHVQNGHSIG